MKLENYLSGDYYWFKPPKINEICTIFFEYHPIQINIPNFNSLKNCTKEKTRHLENGLLILNDNNYFSVQYALHFIINLRSN